MKLLDFTQKNSKNEQHKLTHTRSSRHTENHEYKTTNINKHNKAILNIFTDTIITYWLLNVC